MFSAKLILSSFDFRRTFHQIWPLANSKLTEMNQDDFYVILLKSLYENNALELLPEVIDRLSLRSRNELFCSLVGLNKEKIMAFIRSALDQTAYGKHIAFSDIQLMAEENDDLSFSIDGIDICYDKLLKEEKVDELLDGKAFLFQIGSALSFHHQDDILISRIKKRNQKKVALEKTQQVLESAGVFLKVSDMILEKDQCRGVNRKTTNEGMRALPVELTDALVDVLSECLQSTNPVD